MLFIDHSLILSCLYMYIGIDTTLLNTNQIYHSYLFILKHVFLPAAGGDGLLAGSTFGGGFAGVGKSSSGETDNKWIDECAMTYDSLTN